MVVGLLYILWEEAPHFRGIAENLLIEGLGRPGRAATPVRPHSRTSLAFVEIEVDNTEEAVDNDL